MKIVLDSLLIRWYYTDMEKALVPPQKYLSVYPEWVDGYIYCLMTDCCYYNTYKALPTLIIYMGEEYAKTGWNSDRNTAYYKKGSGLQLALYA